jgi:hypothetical protein
MIGQRTIDLIWNLGTSALKPILGQGLAERFASALVVPLSLAVYFAAFLGDNINKEDCLGWAVLARRL